MVLPFIFLVLRYIAPKARPNKINTATGMRRRRYTQGDDVLVEALIDSSLFEMGNPGSYVQDLLFLNSVHRRRFNHRESNTSN